MSRIGAPGGFCWESSPASRLARSPPCCPCGPAREPCGGWSFETANLVANDEREALKHWPPYQDKPQRHRGTEKAQRRNQVRNVFVDCLGAPSVSLWFVSLLRAARIRPAIA